MMRYFLILIAFALLAFQQPGLVEAQRYKPAVKKTSKTTRASARPGARQRAIAKAQSKKIVRPRSAKIATGFARLGKGMRASVAMRSSVRAQKANSKSALKSGELTAAAVEASRSPLRNAKGQFVSGPRKISTRERFAMWRANRAVKKAALKQAKGRSAKGDLQGTADALQALNVLEANGKLGMVARWQKARVAKKAFKNVRKSASASLKAGEIEQAGQSYAFAAGMKPGSRQMKKMAATMVKESFQMAASYAKAGNGQLTWNVLEMGAAIAQEGGAKFSEKSAQKLVDKAFKNAMPVLTKAAEQAYKSGDVQQAVSLLAEARAIPRNINAKPSRGTLKKQEKLAQKLGPRLSEFEQAQAAQQQSEAAN